MVRVYNQDSTDYRVVDVFTPTTPARYTFVERESINDKLVAALRTPGKQIVVYGYSGSGKTTLLENKLHQLYENHITSRCITGLTFDQLVLDAFDQLGSFYSAEKIETKKRTFSTALEAEYSGIKAKIGRDISNDTQTKQQLVLPPQLTPQNLARFLGEAKCCWVLEDFHKIEPKEKKKLAQVMKVFMDMADRHSEVKIIAIGAVDTARQVVEYDAEMRNRVSEIYVPLMTDKEINRIPEKGELLLNFRFTRRVKDELIRYSSGLASVCHQLCLNMCFVAEINMTLSKSVFLDKPILKKAIEQYVAEASDTLKSAFDKAFRQVRETKSIDAQIVVEALLRVSQDGASEIDILKKIQKQQPKYPIQRLIVSLEQLQKDEQGMIIRYESSSGRYSFKDPFYRAYALAYTKNDHDDDESQGSFISSDLEELLVKLLDERNIMSRPSRANYQQKVATKMDWSNKVFTQKRKNKHRR